MKVTNKQLREAVLGFTKAHYKQASLALSDPLTEEDCKLLRERHAELFAAETNLIRLGTELLQL